MNDTQISLKNINIFSNLEPEELEKIERRCERRSYAPGTHIIDKLSTAMDVYFILRGMVRVVNFSESGREVSLKDIEEGGFFGELAAIDGHPRSANVVAVYSTTAICISQELFWSLLVEYPEINQSLLRHLAKMVRVSVERIMDISTLSAHGRVYGELLKLAQKRIQADGSGRISPIPVHSELASRISTTRETVARILSELNRKGIVVKERNVLIVRDLNALEALQKAQM